MASGPSMCQADADLVRDWRNSEYRQAIAINNTFRLAPWVDHIYACDSRWWKTFHAEVIEKCCNATLWTYHDHVADAYNINKADIPAGKTGGNSGNQAARLAVTELQACRIILLGYDMQGGHWHGKHPKGWPNPDASNFKQWIVHMGRLRQEFPAVEFINATRETAIPAATIPRMKLEDALQ